MKKSYIKPLIFLFFAVQLFIVLRFSDDFPERVFNLLALLLAFLVFDLTQKEI